MGRFLSMPVARSEVVSNTRILLDRVIVSMLFVVRVLFMISIRTSTSKSRALVEY